MTVSTGEARTLGRAIRRVGSLVKGGATISADSSPSRIAIAAQGNPVEFFRYWGSSKLVRRHESPEISWIESGAEFSLFNHVYQARLRPETAEETIEEILSNYEARALTFEWSILPGTEPADLSAMLRGHGFTFEGDKPSMTIDLKRLTTPAPPAKLLIRKVESDEDLQAFMLVTKRAFGVSDRDHGIFLDILRSLGVGGRSRYECYLGILNGQPVATSMLFRTEGVAGVYWVGTVPEGRGKGIGTQMTMEPLIDARTAGLDIATLQATSMGEPVYRRIGFEDCFRFGVYVHKHVPQ